MNKASAADTVDMGSITGLVKPKVEKSLYSHPASRLGISNKMDSVKLSLCVVDRWANDSLLSKNEQFFRCLLDNLVNKDAITTNLRKKLSKCVERTVENVNFF